MVSCDVVAVKCLPTIRKNVLMAIKERKHSQGVWVLLEANTNIICTTVLYLLYGVPWVFSPYPIGCGAHARFEAVPCYVWREQGTLMKWEQLE